MNFKETNHEPGSCLNKLIAPLDISFDDFHENKTTGIITPWVVRRRDILYMTRFFQETGCTDILDAGCGYGFIGSLIAMEGLPVTGIDISDQVLTSPFRHSLLTLRQGDLERLENPEAYDGVIISWPNAEPDFAGIIGKINPRAIVYVMETSGITNNKDGKHLQDLMTAYRPILFWDNVNFRDINSTLYRIITGGTTGTLVPHVFKTSHNRVILFVRREMDPRGVIEALQKMERKEIPGYSWETETDRFYRIGEHLNGGRQILWKLHHVPREAEFLREMAYSGIIEKGLVL